MHTISKNFEVFFTKRVNSFIKRIKCHVLADKAALNGSYRHLGDYTDFQSAIAGDYSELKEGQELAKTWEASMIHLTGAVPSEWRGKRVVAELDFNAEGFVFDANGKTIQGITNCSVFDFEFSRDLVTISESASGGESVELYIEASTVQPWGIKPAEYPDTEPDDPDRYGVGKVIAHRFRLRVFDQEIFDLLMDTEVLFDLYTSLPEASVRRAQILHGINQAIDVYGEGRGDANAARAILKPYLEAPANASAISTATVGHAHIDTAWLWPIRETVRKSARTFANQLRLMEKYPDYVFGASQPQHYQMIKDHFPDLYEEIKAAHKRGQWELQGGMWVEADCNLISGESMVRQFLHGKNFFMDEFGEDVRNLWIPDVFGYSAAMPQIMQLSGVDTFLTQKISWSQFTDFPYHTFNWRGIDGSEVLTHFPPANTYNANLRSSQTNHAQEHFKEKHFLPEFITLFGVGDGGGGPREDFIEYGKRQANLEGAAKIHFDSAQNFFDRLQTHREKLPVWHGELYLEYHRGTYTTQAQVKRKNRLLEQRMRELEMLYSLAGHENYPRETFDDMWKQILVNQFHDIIPGSSINIVYEETNKQYDDLLDQCDQLQDAFAEKVMNADADSLSLFNSLSNTYNGEIILPEGWRGVEGHATQIENDRCVLNIEIPALSTVVLKKANDAASLSTVTELVLENDLIRYEFNPDGQLISAYDKEIEREVLEQGQVGNVFSLYHDRPLNYDAWDIDIYYENEFTASASAVMAPVVQQGPVRSRLNVELAVGDSKITQQISLPHGTKRLDFDTTVDWREKHEMLRVAFPVDVHVDHAKFDIQYGYTQRPTHRNTDWDIARFEVCAHKWVDLSDSGYGVALLNNCKYGHKLFNNVIDLCVLRSPTWPDPEADTGVHHLRYAFLPHADDLVHADVQREAHNFNQVPVQFAGYANDLTGLPISASSNDVHVAVIKQAEKENAWIVRLVEEKGKHSKIDLSLAQSAEVHVCDLMEWHDKEALPHDGNLSLRLKPFEIRTLKIKA